MSPLRSLHQHLPMPVFAGTGTGLLNSQDDRPTALLHVYGHGVTLEGEGLLILRRDSRVEPHPHGCDPVRSKNSNFLAYQKLRTHHWSLFVLSSAPESLILNGNTSRNIQSGATMGWTQLRMRSSMSYSWWMCPRSRCVSSPRTVQILRHRKVIRKRGGGRDAVSCLWSNHGSDRHHATIQSA